MPSSAARWNLLAARCPQEGCTEALMLAHRITIDQLIEPIQVA
jgi:hypothetical protein